MNKFKTAIYQKSTFQSSSLPYHISKLNQTQRSASHLFAFTMQQKVLLLAPSQAHCIAYMNAINK